MQIQNLVASPVNKSEIPAANRMTPQKGANGVITRLRSDGNERRRWKVGRMRRVRDDRDDSDER